MRILRTPILLLCSVFLMISACDKTPPVPIDYKYGYQPLAIGHTVEYTVDSVIYSPLYQGGKKSFSWQVKEVVESTFLDNLGREAYRIERYRRANDTLQWFISDVWYAVPEPTRLERVEENLRFVRLIFPPNEGARWMGNVYVPSSVSDGFYSNWEYEYDQVDEPYSLSGYDFDSTLTVLEVDDSTAISKRYSKSIYAKNVGLIYRDLFNLWLETDSIPIQPGPWESMANRGYTTRIRIKSF